VFAIKTIFLLPLVALPLIACAKGNTLEGGSGGGGDFSSAETSTSATGTGGASTTSTGTNTTTSTGSSGAGGPNALLPFMVLRVGDGTSGLTNAATAAFVERKQTDGTPAPGGPATIALPTTSAAGNVPLTLSGTASAEGNLSLSENGKFVLFAGYAAGVGTAAVASTTSDIVPRVAGRIDTTWNVKSNTVLGAAFSGSGVRGAASQDGTSLYISGNGSATTGGVFFATLGVGGSTQILADPSNSRFVGVFGAQLYGSSGMGTFVNVFTIGSGLPTAAGQIGTPLAGMPTTSASPYAFVLLDRLPGISGVDTMYVADDRSLAMGGGIQKWTFDGSSWSLFATWSDGTTSVRGLAAMGSGMGVRIVATTTEATENRIVTLYDDGSGVGDVVTIATAAPNTVYRGVAFAPQ